MLSMKVLLIDDNQDNRTLIEFALQKNTNWEILTASDGIEGIIKAESEIPDVILLDLIMPDLDGLTVYEILKNNLFTCKIPVIFITAMVNSRVLAELKATDAIGVITKPFNIVTLASDILHMCDRDLFIEEVEDEFKIKKILTCEKKIHNFRLVPLFLN